MWNQAISQWLHQRVRLVFVLFGLMTAGLLVPFLWMAPTETATSSPDDPIFRAAAQVSERFASPVYTMSFLVSANGGDLLEAETLRALDRLSRAVVQDPDVGPKLFTYTSAELEIQFTGIFSLSDAVAVALKRLNQPSISDADPDTLRHAGSIVIDRLRDAKIQILLPSDLSTHDPSNDLWTVPTIALTILADQDAIGGGAQSISLGADAKTLQKEAFARSVLSILQREPDHITVQGIALDVNLASKEQGEKAAPYIAATILAVLLVVCWAFREFWVAAITTGAIATLMIWIKGLSNLVGLKDDLVLQMIIPVAMISFGVDAAIHTIERWNDARASLSPTKASQLAIAAALPALFLAFLTDAAAFLSNLVADIESVKQLGIAGALSMTAAFLLLGVLSPLAIAHCTQRQKEPQQGANAPKPTGGWLRWALTLGGVLWGCVTVLASVFVGPWEGLLLLGLYGVFFIALPYWGRFPGVSQKPVENKAHQQTARLSGGLVGLSAARPKAALALLLVVTVWSGFVAARLPVEFEIKHLLASDSAFVRGLEAFEEHISTRGGEPATIYIEADLREPAVMQAIERADGRIAALRSPSLVALPRSGQTRTEPGALAVLRAALQDPALRPQIEQRTGALLAALPAEDFFSRVPYLGKMISGFRGDAPPPAPLPIPDRATIDAALALAAAQGVDDGRGRPVYIPEEIQTLLWFDGQHTPMATRIEIQLSGSKSRASIEQAKALLGPVLQDLNAELKAASGGGQAVLTGGPFTRQSQLDAIAGALQWSLPVALLICFVIAAVAMRSVKLALFCLITISCVIVWLYALMAATGYTLNIVTATIGALAVGIGVDYAMHFVMRYRELRRDFLVAEALSRAGRSTGFALLISAATSVIGFVVMAFAPMPLFASYGLFTALMILLALLASLIVLPALLVVFDRAEAQAK